jgi:hypothetical protein
MGVTVNAPGEGGPHVRRQGPGDCDRKKQYVTKTIRVERREAGVALGRMLGEIEDGQFAVRAGTVGDLCEKWFARAEPDLSAVGRVPSTAGCSTTSSPVGARCRCAVCAPPTSTSDTPSCAARPRSTAARSRPTP